MRTALEIDASAGEGGGQVFRTSLCLSAITKRPVRLSGIRAKRPDPGLKPQHLAVARAFERGFDAHVRGAEIGSTGLLFDPGEPRGGELAVTIPTAGSVTLAAQALLPALSRSEKFWDVALTGGTDVAWSPTWDYFSRVYLRILERHGLRARALVRRRGFFPRGGGAIRIEVQPGAVSALRPTRGANRTIAGRIAIANLPEEMGSRMRAAISSGASQRGLSADVASSGVPALDQGVTALLTAESGDALVGVDALGEKGVAAEIIGERLVSNLHDELRSASTVDSRACDQLMVYAALYGGEFVARELSSHARTQIDVIRQFLPSASIGITEEAGGFRLRFEPRSV